MSVATSSRADDFSAWLETVRAQARGEGISEATLAALDGLTADPRVIELDQRQPEFTQTFWGYLDNHVTERRIERGRELLSTHAALLQQVADTYGVPARFLVSFWGLESNFGDNMGSMSVLRSTATLAFNPRRREFFTRQLLDALHIIEEGHITAAEMTGSWAGAMGQLQFIPSTFKGYAVDFDGDGRRNIWTSLPDIFASAANYLKSVGWVEDETWGREVHLPQDFDLGLLGESGWRHIGAWHALGVRKADGSDLPIANIEGQILLPGGYQGPAFLAYANYDVILRWNRSALYAISVGHLADRYIGAPPLLTPRPVNDVALSRADVLEVQERLNALGHNAGEPDGIIGTQTRAAIAVFQRSKGLPADGYASAELLAALRAASQ